MKRVVITGLGTINPLGHDVESTWEAVKRGECGIAPITLYDTTDRKVKLAAEVKNYEAEKWIDKREAKRMDRFTQFAVIAAKEAVQDAGFDMEKEDASRFGVIVSSGIGGLTTIEVEDGKGREKGYDRVSPLFIPMVIANMAAGTIAIEHGFQGICSCVVTACAGGTNAIGEAFSRIRHGREDVRWQ